LTLQNGFNNMAQAFAEADTMFPAGRQDAESALMIISNGKYALEYQTKEKATALKEDGVRVYMVTLNENEDKRLEVLKEMATQPWSENFEYIPNVGTLLDDTAAVANTIVTRFCPNSISPSVETAKANKYGYFKLKLHGKPPSDCGTSTGTQYLNVNSPAACEAFAKQQNADLFTLKDPYVTYSNKYCWNWHYLRLWSWGWHYEWCGWNTHYHDTACTTYRSATDMTKEMFEEYVLWPEKTPTCPGGSGSWTPTGAVDTYVLNPSWASLR